jgi:hypothetical protein
MVAVSVGAYGGDDKDLPKEIKDVMKEHKKDGRLPKVKTAVKDGKWGDAKDPAKKLMKNGEGLVKLTPSKGDKASWEKLAKEYKENTENLYKAVDKMDKAKAQEAVKKLDGSCMPCHKMHR